MKSKLKIQPIMVDIDTAAEILAISKSTVEALIRNNDFPKGRKASARRVGYLVRELEAWAESRPVSDILPPPNTGRNATA